MSAPLLQLKHSCLHLVLAHSITVLPLTNQISTFNTFMYSIPAFQTSCIYMSFPNSTTSNPSNITKFQKVFLSSPAYWYPIFIIVFIIIPCLPALQFFLTLRHSLKMMFLRFYVALNFSILISERVFICIIILSLYLDVTSQQFASFQFFKINLGIIKQPSLKKTKICSFILFVALRLSV